MQHGDNEIKERTWRKLGWAGVTVPIELSSWSESRRCWTLSWLSMCLSSVHAEIFGLENRLLVFAVRVLHGPVDHQEDTTGEKSDHQSGETTKHCPAVPWNPPAGIQECENGNYASA